MFLKLFLPCSINITDIELEIGSREYQYGPIVTNFPQRYVTPFGLTCNIHLNTFENDGDSEFLAHERYGVNHLVIQKYMYHCIIIYGKSISCNTKYCINSPKGRQTKSQNKAILVLRPVSKRPLNKKQLL